MLGAPYELKRRGYRHCKKCIPVNRQSQSAEVGSTIQSKGSTTLKAGNDLNARAANVQAGGELGATAGHNIVLEAGAASQTDASGRTSSSSGGLSSSTTTTRQSTSQTQALGSSLGGSKVTLASEGDLTIRGSNVVADQDLALSARNNLKIEAAQNTQIANSFYQKSESGVMSGGGIGATIGTREQSQDQKGTSTTAEGQTLPRRT